MVWRQLAVVGIAASDFLAAAGGDGAGDFVGHVEGFGRAAGQFGGGDFDGAVATGDGEGDTVTAAALFDEVIALGPQAALFERRVEAVDVFAALDEEVVDLGCVLESVPGGVDEGDAPPAQTDDRAFQLVEGTELYPIVEVGGAGMVGLIGEEGGPGGQFVAQAGRVVVDGPFLRPEFLPEVEGEVFGIEAFGRVLLRNTVPALVLDDFEIGRIGHVSD